MIPGQRSQAIEKEQAMFEIREDGDGTIFLEGILDSIQVDTATEYFRAVTTSCVVDLHKLEYVSSAGLGMLLAAQQRLLRNGQKIKLRDPSPSVRKILELARFNILFDIDDQSAQIQGPPPKNTG